MLDDEEYAEVRRLYWECVRGMKEFRKKWGVPLESPSVRERFLPIRKYYEQVTGMRDCHESAIMHHRLSDFGAPCSVCGKPLRTPRAKFCAACGAVV